MALDQTDRYLQIKFPDLGTKGAAILEEFQGEESLSQPFLYRLSILSEEKELDPTKIVGKKVEFQVQYNKDDKVPFHGMVLSLTRVQMDVEDKLYRYRLEVVPHVWFLKFRSDNRIFQEKTALEIVQEVLKDEKIEVVTKTSATYKKREYCVQFGESDFDFVSRLLEEEGIFYYFERTETSHKLVLGDDIKAYQNAKENEPIFSGDRETSGAADLVEWEQTTEFVTGNYLQNDHNFQTFGAKNEGKSKSSLTLKSAQTQEVYEYPAGYDFGDKPETTKEEMKRWPEIRLQELEVPAEIVRGESHCYSWTPGFKFKKDSVEYVLTSVTHRYSDSFGVSVGSSEDPIPDEQHNFFTAMKATRVFRPLRVTPPSRIYGVQSAKVVGPSKKEVHTDQFGRVKVQFHWDRLGKNDDKSSCYIRVAQQWAGKDRGFWFLPRVGDEVLIQFINGDPDRPVIVGSVYNDQNTIPKAQPDNKQMPDASLISGIWTQTSDKGTAQTRHELIFNDTKEKELITFKSQKDFKRIVKNNDELEVGLETKDKGDQTITIQNDQTITLNEGNQTMTLKKGNREVNLDQGDDTLTVKQGNFTIAVKSGEMMLEAAKKITLKVGPSTIVLEPAGIKINGTKLELTGTASAKLTAPTTDVNGDGMTNIKGGLVNIN